MFEKSYYESSVERPALRSALKSSVKYDICIIGGGFTGLSSALELANKGYSVIVLESQGVGWGASGRNGGQCVFGYSTGSLSKIAKQGKVSEKWLFDVSLQAVQLIRDNIKKYNIDCDWQSGYAEAATKPSHLEELKQYAEKLQKDYDYGDVKILDATQFRQIIASRRYHGALLNDFSGHLHPLKYLLGMAEVAEKAGVKIFEQTTATEIKRKQDGYDVTTDKNATVSCNHVLVACNAYHNNLLASVHTTVMPVGTYIGATSILGETSDALIADKRSICDTNFILDYFRCSKDKRLLFGGRCSYSTVPPPNIANSIYKRMVHVFPQLQGVNFDYTWGGFVAITINRFPDIGRTNDGVYYAQGFSGHGVALSNFTGTMIAKAISGESEVFDVFDQINHQSFMGGQYFRTPLLVLAMAYYRLRDLL